MSKASASKARPSAGFQPFQAEGAAGRAHDAQSVDLPKIKADLPTYMQIKSKFKQNLRAADSRFSLSEHVANQLSLEEEESRRFQKKVEDAVKDRLSVIETEAKKEGFQKGFDAGRNEAFGEEKARIAQYLENLASAVKAIESAKLQLGQQYEASLVDLSLRIAEQIAKAEVHLDPKKISDTILAILERIAKEDDVRIWLPSSTIECFDEIKKEVDQFSRSGRVTFDVNPSLAEGSCVVESLSGEIASSIDERVKKLGQELRRRTTDFNSPGEETGT